jgi:hypothetical protein
MHARRLCAAVPSQASRGRRRWVVSPFVMEENIQAKRKKTRRLQMQPLSRRDILFWGLFGFIPATLAAWALAVKEIHFKVHPDMYFHATPDHAPFGYWFYIGLCCITATLLWGRVLYSVFRIVFPCRHSNCDKGTTHDG